MKNRKGIKYFSCPTRDFARSCVYIGLFGHVLFTVPRGGRTAVEAVALTRGYAGARATRRRRRPPHERRFGHQRNMFTV